MKYGNIAKGGYQIIDLSSVTVGTQATISGIYDIAKDNNTKPFMIKTPDGQSVFAEVKAGTNKYVTAYLGADGSTYTVEISNANKVDITKQESGAETDARLDALEARVNAKEFKSANAVDLFQYDGSEVAKKCLATSDGYLWIRVNNAATNHVQINVQSNDRANTYDVHVWGNTNGQSDYMLFVKKGFYLYYATNVGTGNTAYFTPFE